MQQSAHNALSNVYSAALYPTGPGAAPRYELEVVIRLMAIGATAVRKENWQAVRRLSGLRVRTRFEPETPFLLRSAHLSAGRAGLLGKRGNEGVSIISLARELAERHVCMRVDLPAESEELLNSLCQFSALSSLVAIGETDNVLTGSYWPEFLGYYEYRTEPVLELLLSDKQMRQMIFPWSDELLASALKQFLEIRRTTSFVLIGAFGGYENLIIRRFLAMH